MLEITVGKMWGEFEILEKIGSGGMGVVYKARQRSPERTVALKILIPEKLSSAQLRRFAKEAQLSAMLEHPNIVKVYLLGNHQNTPFIAMAYIDGESLADYLQKSPPLAESLKIVKSIACALDYAHREGVVHRDIKPANILVSREGTPYLMDFGIARSIKIEDRSLTKTGQILGTPQYMSPEQAQGLRREIDGRSDIYSIGAILYEIATGHAAVCGDSPMQILFNVVNKPVIFTRESPHVPEPLERIIMKAMAHHRQKRYQSAGQLARDIENFLEGAAVSARPRRALLRKRYWLPAAAVLSIAVWLLWPWRATPLPGDLSAILAQARHAFQRGDLGLADRHLEAIFTLAPDHKQALSLQVSLFEKQGRTDEMRLVWARLAELTPDAGELRDLGKNAMDAGHLVDARNYLEKSVALEDTATSRMLLADVLFYLGRYREAENHYLAVGDAQAMPGLAAIYSDGRQYPRAWELLCSIPGDVSFSPYLRARMCLARALTRWGMIQRELERWEWLFSREKDRRRELRAVLGETTEDLGRAARALTEDAGKSYPLRRLQSELELYRTAAILESEVSEKVAAEFPAYRARLEEAAITPATRMFLVQVGIRSLIRNGLWEEAYRECNSALEDYPWVAGFYHLRALAIFHCTRFSDPIADALKDIHRVRDYEPWNVVPLENFLFLLFDVSTLQECQYIMEIFIAYHTRLRESVEQDVLSEYSENLRHDCLGLLPQGTKVPEWNELLKVALDSPSTGARQLARDILAGQYDNAGLFRKMDEIRNRPMSQTRMAELDNLAEALDRRRKSDRLQYLQKMLVKLTADISEDICIKIREMGPEGEALLCEILKGEDAPPMLRLLSARMMMSLRTLSAYETLAEIARGGRHPASLLAATALAEKGIEVDLGTVLSRENPGEDFISAQHPLYQTLWAVYLDPGRYRRELATLLHGKDEMASLCAAFNLRRCHLQLSPELRESVVSCFLQRMASENPRIRAVAIAKFWQLESAGLEKNYGLGEYSDYWARYGHTLLSILREEKDPQVLFSAAHGLIASPYFARCMWKPEFQSVSAFAQLPFVLAARVHSPDSDYFAKFWATAALGSLRNELIWPILEDTALSFCIRTATFVGIMDNNDDEGLASTMNYIQRFTEFMEKKAKAPAGSLNDRILKQTATLIITLPHIHLLSRTPIKEILRSALDDPDPSVRSLALSMLGFFGEEEDIALLSFRLEDPEVNIRRAATASLALLLMRRRPGELAAYEEGVKKQPDSIRKAVAYGYYNVINRENLFRSKSFSLKFPKVAKNYDMELGRLLEGQTEKWAPMLEKAGELWPTTRYFYESALLAHKSRHYAYAHGQIDRALSFLDREPADRQKDFEKRCHMLRADIYTEENRPREAVACLENIVKKYPLAQKLHFRLSILYLDLGERDKYCRHLWLSYLCDPIGFRDDLNSKSMARGGAKRRHDEISAALEQKFSFDK